MERIVIPKRPKPVFDESVCHRLLEALRNNYLVDFHYKSKWEPDKIWRRVMPYQLVIDEGQIFLYAADENDETAARLYNLYRIHHLFVHKDRTFTLPKNFRFVEDFECGRWGAFQYDETYDYKIEFRGDARAYVHERIWADDQQFTEDEERGVTVMTFSSSQWIPIEHWLLSFGGNARPIEPDWFVEDWKKEVRKMTEWL